MNSREVTAQDDAYNAEIADLFRAHAARLRGYIRNLGADGALADDIVQDSFLALGRHWPRVRTYRKPEAYLYKVATNMVRCAQGSRYLHEEPRAEPWDMSRDIPENVDPESDEEVWKALRQLPRRQREIVLLRKAYDFSERDTAEILGISKGTVKSYLSLGLRRLEEILKTYREEG